MSYGFALPPPIPLGLTLIMLWCDFFQSIFFQFQSKGETGKLNRYSFIIRNLLFYFFPGHPEAQVFLPQICPFYSLITSFLNYQFNLPASPCITGDNFTEKSRTLAGAKKNSNNKNSGEKQTL